MLAVTLRESGNMASLLYYLVKTPPAAIFDPKSQPLDDGDLFPAFSGDYDG
jgi:hypothetical protein